MDKSDVFPRRSTSPVEFLVSTRVSKSGGEVFRTLPKLKYVKIAGSIRKRKTKAKLRKSPFVRRVGSYRNRYRTRYGRRPFFRWW